MRKTTIIVFFLSFFCGLQAQEVLTELSSNPVIDQFVKQNINVKKKKKTIVQEAHQLPLFDDFTGDSPYPKATLWSDSAAFINSSFPLFPTNRGVATLDALNKNGELYDGAGSIPFLADTLTSVDIRLDSVFSPVPRPLTAEDSVYLSFYFQPGGLGNAPNSKDSLMLEFYLNTVETLDTTFQWIEPDTVWEGGGIVIDSIIPGYDSITAIDTLRYENWDRVWSSEGMRLDTFTVFYGHPFHQVLIPITDEEKYFKKSFRFRFRNIASLSDDQLLSWQSNTDFWHIDYVYLNSGRFYQDIFYDDVSFVYPASKFLKYYTAMPYNHYYVDPYYALNDTIEMLMTNLDAFGRYAGYYYQMEYDDASPILNARYPEINEYATELPSYYEGGYVDVPSFRNPPIVRAFPPYPDTRDSATYYVKHYLSTLDKGSGGDTVVYKQEFNNFFAYDDGIPEAGYGLTPSGAQMACFFDMATKDTLRAVDLYFNKTASNANLQYFYLTIWNGSKVGNDSAVIREVLYQEQVLPQKEFTNQFYRFYLKEPVPLERNFFVGTEQTTDDNLNLGYDKTNVNGKRTLFKVDGSNWYQSQYSGSVMIRPVVGKKLSGNDYQPLPQDNTITIGPNPITKRGGTLSVFQNNQLITESFEGRIYAIDGKMVYSWVNQSTISVASLQKGVYLIEIVEDSKTKSVKKLIISN